jgi:hypothetical protein
MLKTLLSPAVLNGSNSISQILDCGQHFIDTPLLWPDALWKAAADRISERVSINALQPTCDGMIQPTGCEPAFRREKI